MNAGAGLFVISRALEVSFVPSSASTADGLGSASRASDKGVGLDSDTLAPCVLDWSCQKISFAQSGPGAPGPASRSGDVARIVAAECPSAMQAFQAIGQLDGPVFPHRFSATTFQI